MKRKTKLFFNQPNRERGGIREWMEGGEHAKLQEWLRRSKQKLETLFEAGEVPVVGWLQLAATMDGNPTHKRNLEAELDENGKDLQQVAEQIRNLLEKQEKLEKRNHLLLEQKKRVDQISALEAERESIAMLGEKEKACLARLDKQMENPYFMACLDSQDVSTVFSLFNMDPLFFRFKKNDIDNNLAVTATTQVADLQKDFEIEFSEAVELLWKLKLLKHGEKGVACHLAKCKICSSTNPSLLLREYGLQAAEIKEVEEKMKGWKGYYFPTANARSVAGELGLARELRSKLTTCWVNNQNVHKWEHQQD